MRFEDLTRRSGEAFGAGLINAVLFDVPEVGKGDALNTIKARFPDGVPNAIQMPTEWFTETRPAELSQAGAARTTIGFVVAALLFAIVGVNVHSLLGFVRQRGRAYAVLKSLGFTPRQVRSSVFWQSSVVVVTAVALSLPLGVAGGRLLGRAFADAIGVIHPSVFPVLLVLLSAVSALVILQLGAFVPAIRASRAAASRHLRAE
jgi:ABC-type antimicrobial peptide transport system permease subunit